MANVPVSLRGHDVGRTNGDGLLAVTANGAEGEQLAVRIACPDGSVAAEGKSYVTLYALAKAAQVPEYTLHCTPIERTLVVVVRAAQGPHLPVIYLGKEVARTDDAGIAHVALRVPMNEAAEVTLSTDGPGGERLRPQNPSLRFGASEEDAIRLFRVDFEVEPTPKKRVAPVVASLPVRLR